MPQITLLVAEAVELAQLEVVLAVLAALPSLAALVAAVGAASQLPRPTVLAVLVVKAVPRPLKQQPLVLTDRAHRSASLALAVAEAVLLRQ